MTGRVFVVFGDDWGRNVSTMQHIFQRIATYDTVVWVNGIGHRAPSLRWTDVKRAVAKVRAMVRRSAAPAPAPTSQGTPAAIVQPRVLPWHNRPWVRRFNVHSLERDIRRALERVAPGRRPILVTGSPPSVGVVGRLGETSSVYFCMDDFTGYPGVDAAMIGPLEQELLGRVDALVATAEDLLHTKRPRSGRTFRCAQGVNFQHFSTPRDVPEDLATLPRPVIGLAGSLNAGTDLALLNRVAQAVPRGTVVLVGPVRTDTSALTAPNIRQLGPRPYAELPAYVQAFDLALVPYHLNEWTKAIDPLKLLEYMAAGVPVVSTAMAEAFKFQHLIRVADDHDGFVDAVRDILAGNRPPTALAQTEARRHTWEARTESLLEYVDELQATVSSPDRSVPATMST